MKTQAALCSVALAAMMLVAPGSARAANIFEHVSTSAGLLDFDPSPRSSSMADAGTAMFWGTDPNGWANPALLGYARGLCWEQGGRSLDGDLVIKTRSTTFGWGGVGFSAMGQPFEGLGHVEMGGGISGGGVEVTFDDRVRSWGVGVSAAHALAMLAAARGRPAPAWTHDLDVAIGFAEKRDQVDFTNSDQSGTSRSSEHTTADDLGLLACAGRNLRWGALGAGRIDGAFGFAAINVNAPKMGSLPTARDWRYGLAFRAVFDGPRRWPGLPEWLASGLAPLVSGGRRRGRRAHDEGHLSRASLQPRRVGRRVGNRQRSVRAGRHRRRCAPRLHQAHFGHRGGSAAGALWRHALGPRRGRQRPHRRALVVLGGSIRIRPAARRALNPRGASQPMSSAGRGHRGTPARGRTQPTPLRARTPRAAAMPPCGFASAFERMSPSTCAAFAVFSRMRSRAERHAARRRSFRCCSESGSLDHSHGVTRCTPRALAVAPIRRPEGRMVGDLGPCGFLDMSRRKGVLA